MRCIAQAGGAYLHLLQFERVVLRLQFKEPLPFVEQVRVRIGQRLPAASNPVPVGK